MLLAASLAFQSPLRRTILTVFRLPFAATRTLLAILMTLPRLPSLAQENASLRSEMISRQLDNAQLREQLRQAAQATALRSVSAGRGVVARVIGRSTIPTQHTVLLDQGARQGLTLDTVIVDASGLIGRVMEVHPATALVMLRPIRTAVWPAWWSVRGKPAWWWAAAEDPVSWSTLMSTRTFRKETGS